MDKWAARMKRKENPEDLLLDAERAEETLQRVIEVVEVEAQAGEPDSVWWDLLLMIRDRMPK